MKNYFKAVMENSSIPFSVEKDLIVDISFMDNSDLLQFINAPAYQFFNYLDDHYSEYKIEKVEYSEDLQSEFEQE